MSYCPDKWFCTQDKWFCTQASGFACRTSGFACRTSGFARRTSGFACRTSGFARRTSGFACRTSGFAGQVDILKPAMHFCWLSRDFDNLRTPLHFTIYTPETKFGGVYRSHPVVGRLVGRSVGPAVRCVFLFQYNFIQ